MLLVFCWSSVWLLCSFSSAKSQSLLDFCLVSHSFKPVQHLCLRYLLVKQPLAWLPAGAIWRSTTQEYLTAIAGTDEFEWILSSRTENGICCLFLSLIFLSSCNCGYLKRMPKWLYWDEKLLDFWEFHSANQSQASVWAPGWNTWIKNARAVTKIPSEDITSGKLPLMLAKQPVLIRKNNIYSRLNVKAAYYNPFLCLW